MRIAFPSFHYFLFEKVVRRSLVAGHKSTTYLYPVSAQDHGSKHGSAGGDSARGNERNTYFLLYRRNQDQGSGLVPAVVSPCFEAFGNYGVDPCILRF